MPTTHRPTPMQCIPSRGYYERPSSNTPIDSDNTQTLVDMALVRRIAQASSHWGVAVSGGPDSVALLHLLASLREPLGIQVTALHYNYRLRGAESDKDEDFVRTLCQQLKIPVLVCTATVVDPKPSEAAMRQTRYDFFAETRIPVIALGHTMDDLLETQFMHIVRGHGSRGLAVRTAHQTQDNLLIRPLWKTSRELLLQWLEQQGLQYRTDESNAQLRYTRNIARHRWIPSYLQEFGESDLQLLRRYGTTAGRFTALAADHVAAKVTRRLNRLPHPVLNRRSLRRQPEHFQEEYILAFLQTLGIRPGGTTSGDIMESLKDWLATGRAQLLDPGNSLWLVTTDKWLWSISKTEVTSREDCKALAIAHIRNFRFPILADTCVQITNSQTPLTIPDLNNQARTIQLPPEIRARTTQLTSISYAPLTQHQKQKLKTWMENDRTPWYLRNYIILALDTHETILHLITYPRANGRLKKQNPE